MTARRLAVFFLALAAASALAAQAPAVAKKKLTLERLYTWPRLEGTAPTGMKWSPDGRKLAFLWNDRGGRFRDLWLYEVEADKLAQLTKLKTPRDAWTQNPAEQDPKLAKYAAPEGGLGAFEWAKDSQQLAFSFRGELYILRLGGEPLRLTKTKEAEGRPRFSSDSSKLIYSLGSDLWLRDLSSGQLVQLTSGGSDDLLNGAPPFPESTARLYEFSPDGRWVAFLEIDRRGEAARLIPNYVGKDVSVRRQRRTFAQDETPRLRLGVVPAEGGAVVWLTKSERQYYDDWRWSPDSNSIALHRVEENWKKRHVGVIDVAQAAAVTHKSVEERPAADPSASGLGMTSKQEEKFMWVRTIYSEEDDKWVCMNCGPLEWSPDGKLVLFLSERDGWNHLYLISAEASEGSRPSTSLGALSARQLTRGEWEVETTSFPAELRPRFSPDGRYIYFTANKEDLSRRDLYRVAVAGGKPERFTARAGYNAALVAPDERRVALLFSSFAEPWDLHIGGFPPVNWKRLTASPLEELAEYDWPQPEIVQFPARDAQKVRALLFRPAATAAEAQKRRGQRARAAGKAPVINFVHGAGYAQAVLDRWGGYLTERFQFNQFLAQQGYAVIDVDYRGSSGYGRDWRTDVYLHLGGKDLEDELAAMDYLKTLGGVDTGRAGVWGVSYGGFMTLMLLFQSPDTFQAGSAWASVTDWANYNRHYTQQRLRTPEEQPQAYQRSSPIHHVAGLKARLQVVHGMVDDNVHFQDAVQLIQELEAAGKQFDLVLYPLESHGWARETAWKHSTEAMFAFFEKHLRNK